MSIKWRKDRKGLKGTKDLYIDKYKALPKKYYFRVYLWKTAKAIHKAIDDPDESALGYFVPRPYPLHETVGLPVPKPLLGEVHFISGFWNLEIVAHEMGHAFIHRLRVLPPYAPAAIAQEEISFTFSAIDNAEELVVYDLGHLVDSAFRWLLSVDGRPKRTRQQ